jgi:hypothetical protein
VAGMFGIEGWERTLPLYLLCLYVIFELLLGYFFGKYKVDEKIADYLMRRFYR